MMASVINVEKKPEGYAVVTMAKEPVNSMDLDFWKQLLAAVEECEKDSKVRGLILASGLKRPLFTAGLDIRELHKPSTSKERFFELWDNLSKVMLKLYGSEMVTMAAIPGACPAGGCGLSLTTDYRVITQNGSMGLNEVALGVGVPKYWAKLLAATTGQTKGHYILQQGMMPKADELLKIDMVDAVVENDKQKLMDHVEAEMKKWLKNPDAGRVATKMALRGDLLEQWKKGVNEEAVALWGFVADPVIEASMGKMLEQLSGAGKSKL